MIKNFPPALFACVMGTGIWGITGKYYSCYWPWLDYLSTALLAVNLLTFLILLIPWILRWLLFRDYALRDLSHPVTGQFYATLPIGCLVLAAQLLAAGENHSAGALIAAARCLWVSGALLALAASLIIPIVNFFNEVSIRDINPAWFMPPVSLIVTPVAGARLIHYWPPAAQKLLLILNYAAWGTGFFLFICVAAICLGRLFIAPPLPGPLTPTVWIHLGPIGVGTIALINLGAAGFSIMGGPVVQTVMLFALILWGVGFWWLMAASILTAAAIVKRNLPFALSWWAFTFPLGAYAGATYLIAVYYQCAALRHYGFFCYLLLSAFWLVVFTRTLARAFRGELFKDPSPKPLSV